MIMIHTLENLTKLYLEEKDSDISTKEGYRCVLKQYIRYLSEHDILCAISNDINEYIDE